MSKPTALIGVLFLSVTSAWAQTPAPSPAPGSPPARDAAAAGGGIMDYWWIIVLAIIAIFSAHPPPYRTEVNLLDRGASEGVAEEFWHERKNHAALLLQRIQWNMLCPSI